MHEPDSIDIEILRQLQVDATKPTREIAFGVGLSTAAAQRRINRLRAEGVIAETTATIDPTAVGLGTTCVVTVNLERDGTEVIDKLKESFRQAPNVQQCYYVTGSCDFILIVIAESMAGYEAFTREFFLNDADIRSFTTHVVLDPVDSRRLLPLGAPGT